MLKIGEFSKLSRVSIRMLRRYNEVGLLLPAETDPITGYRYYSEDQLPAAGRITALRDMGFGLAAIEQLLATWEEPVALEAILDAKQAQLQEEAALAQRRLRALETLRQRLRKEDNAMDYTVNLKTLPQRQAACLRMTIPNYDQEGTLWQILMRETAHLDLQPDDPCYCSVTFHDGEFKERDVDVEAQKTVRGQYPDTEHVQFKLLPPVTFASTVYQGPYEKDRGGQLRLWQHGCGIMATPMTAQLLTSITSAPTRRRTQSNLSRRSAIREESRRLKTKRSGKSWRCQWLGAFRFLLAIVLTGQNSFCTMVLKRTLRNQ